MISYLMNFAVTGKSRLFSRKKKRRRISASGLNKTRSETKRTANRTRSGPSKTASGNSPRLRAIANGPNKPNRTSACGWRSGSKRVGWTAR